LGPLREDTANLTQSAGLILNPAAGKGAARRRLQAITQSFAAVGVYDVKHTTQQGDEERVTMEALDAGWKTIVAVGGDGTCSRVADTILKSGAECALGVVPAGTGNDFAKTLGVASYTPAQVAALVASPARTRIDVGLADGRHFINSCGFGFDASVLEATGRVKFLKGDALYIYAALMQLFTYRGFPIAIDGGVRELAKDLLMVTVSNGRYLGGAFHIAPEASVLDGALDVCVVRDANVLERVRLFATAFRGTHGRLASVRTFRTPGITLSFPSPPAIEIDGELRQARSSEVRIECVPHALTVIAAPDARL